MCNQCLPSCVPWFSIHANPMTVIHSPQSLRQSHRVQDDHIRSLILCDGIPSFSFSLSFPLSLFLVSFPFVVSPAQEPTQANALWQMWYTHPGYPETLRSFLIVSLSTFLFFSSVMTISHLWNSDEGTLSFETLHDVRPTVGSGPCVFFPVGNHAKVSQPSWGYGCQSSLSCDIIHIYDGC